MQELLFWGNQLVAFSNSPFYLTVIITTLWVFLCWLLTSFLLFTSPPWFQPKMKRYRKNVRWPTEPGKTEQRTKMIKPRKTKQNKNEKYNRRPGQNMDRFQRVQIEKLMCRWTTQCSYRSLFIRSMPSTSPEGVFSLSLNFRRRLQKPIICY